MPANISSRKIMARAAFMFLLFAALLFIPAGTIYWPEAWLLLLIYLAWAMPVLAWLKKNNPALLEERTDVFKRPQKSWDKLVVLSGTILFIAMFLTAGMDAVRYHWSSPHFFLKALGFAGLFPSLALMFWTMRENTYLSRIVEIKKGHKVITTGPYRYVRHPMYVGALTFYICIPLALGSLYALIPAALLVLVMAARTYLEDKMLHEELPGYKEYAKKTRYKLVPGVW